MHATPDQTSVELASRLGAAARACEVVSSTQISTSVQEVVLKGSAKELAGLAGNDVMVRVVDGARLTRRRYSVRALDEENDRLSLWVTTAHDGAGSRWARAGRAGDVVDVVGPRGKITLDETADWHLFVGDVSGLGAFYRMAESIEVPGRAIFIVEIEHDDDMLTADFDEGLGVTGIFVERHQRSRNDPSGLLGGLAAFALPQDRGHAYLFGEFSVMKVIRVALLDRGLDDDQISLKAYWRMNRANADHGEPDKSED